MKLIFARSSQKLSSSFSKIDNHMKFRYFFIFIVPSIVLIAYLIWAWMSPKYSTIMVSAIINAPQNVVYPEVANLNRWEKWVSFTEKDPTMHIAVLNLEGNSNQGIQWKGMQNITGNGELKLVSSRNNYNLHYELELSSPRRFKSNGEIQIQMKSFITSTVNITNKEEISFLKRPLSKWLNNSNIIRQECQRSLLRLDSICTVNSDNTFLKAQSTIDIVK